MTTPFCQSVSVTAYLFIS